MQIVQICCLFGQVSVTELASQKHFLAAMILQVGSEDK